MPALTSILKSINVNDKENGLIMWASSIYAFNDPTEMGYAYPYIQNKIKKYEDLHDIKESYRISTYMEDIKLSRFSGIPEEVFISHIYDNSKTPFVVSFSEIKDELPMWNIYGNKGSGVCLVFDENILATIEGNILSNVVYIGRESQNHTTENIIPTIIENECTQCYKDLENIHTPEEIATRKIVAWGTLCAAVGAYLKNGSYYYEKEQRLVLFDTTYSKRKFRNSIHGNIIPYLEISIPLEALNGIIVGPCADTNITYSGLIPLLRNKNIDIEVHKSQIPYRII